MLRGMGWDPSHSTLQVFESWGFGGGEDTRGQYHFPSASWGAAEEMLEGKAGPGQGSSSENGGSKVQRGICLSHLLAKGHREADWWRENKARIFQST